MGPTLVAAASTGQTAGPHREEEILTVKVGDGILDCGATRPGMGELTWHKFLQTLRHLGKEELVQYKTTVRTFRCGNGGCLTAKYEVTIPVIVLGDQKMITVSMVPGDAP